MAEERKGIVYIGTAHIHPHPENPRKTLGDLGELAESLKKNGVMQNLTVVPIEDQPGEYYALIGNRRHGAAIIAGLTKLPCRIVDGMDRREQLSTMLEENIQRNDLTIYEQAQGFQLMLDLGETEESIAEKTGFSKTTVRHRLNIAKLNQKELQKKENEDGFQLSLTDLYELEKIKDIKIRNKILKEARNSRDLASRARGAALEEKRAENAKELKKMLSKLGVKAAPKEYENEAWTGKWKTVLEYELDKEVPKKINLPKDVPADQLFQVVYYRDFRVIMKAPKEKRELSKWEIEQKENEKRKRQIKAVLKESTARRKEFIQGIISGKIAPVKDESKIKDLLWDAMVALGASTFRSSIRQFFLEKDYKGTDEEKQEAEKKVSELSVLHQMMVILHTAMASTNEPFTWKFVFIPAKGEALAKGYEALEPYGWYFEKPEEQQVIDGTYELYAKESELEKVMPE